MILSPLKPPLTFPTLTGSIVTFNSQYAGLPLKSHVVDVDYTGSAISAINIGSDAKYAGFINFNQLVRHNRSSSTVNDVVFTNNNDGSWSVSGTASAESVYYITNDTGVGDEHVILYSYGANSSVSNYRIGDFNYGPSIVSGTSTAFICKRSTPSNFNIGVQIYNGKSIDITLIPQVFDLTAMFGQTKAEEIYNMEQQTAGSGVAYFRSLFPNDYYDYNAGTLTTVSAVNGVSNSFFPITFDTPIYGGSYDCLTGIVTSDKDSGGGDITPTYQQTATANCETSLGENNIWADTGDTTLQYPKFG